MKNKLLQLLFIFTGIVTMLTAKAQDSTNVFNFDFHKIEPIVQVFGTASYNFDENRYDYGFGRAHLGFQYQFNEKWSSKIIIDRGRPTTIGQIKVTDSAGKIFNVQNTSKEGSYYSMWLKFASLRWKVNEKLTIEGGAILQNHYITMERFWGLRYILQTFQDLYWQIPSSDLGFMAYYKLNNFISFDAAITNGEGPRFKQDAYGKVKFAGGINIKPSEKIQTRIFYHKRQSGQDSTATEQMVSVFIGFKPSEKIRIAGEYNYMNNLDNADGLNSYGFSLYTVYHLTNKTELFARYDKLLFEIPDNYDFSNKNVEGNTVMVGVSYSPVKGVNLSLNYQGWISEDDEDTSQNRVLLSMEYKF